MAGQGDQSKILGFSGKGTKRGRRIQNYHARKGWGPGLRDAEERAYQSCKLGKSGPEALGGRGDQVQGFKDGIQIFISNNSGILEGKCQPRIGLGVAQPLSSNLEFGTSIWAQDFSLRLRRDGLKSAGCFSRGPAFNFQHPQSSSQLTVTLVPWDSTPSSGV